MSLLGLPTAPGPDEPESGRRRSVTLLSGFLGSGKTTLLQRELARSAAVPAVLVNDFSETGIDGLLLDASGTSPVVLSGGCACCTRRDDLARALADLLDDEQRGLAPRRDVVIETSGLSDPGPIAFTVANDPVLKHHYALRRVGVTVDALTGRESVARHPVAFRQLLAADDLLVTKADVAAPECVEDVVAWLRSIHPSASISVTARGELIRTEPPPVPGSVEPLAQAEPDAGHTAAVATLDLATDRALDWQAFAAWLSLLLHRHGPDVLRVKGILDVDGAGPVAIHGVQHIVHPPEHLTARVPKGTRLTLIVRDIDTAVLERSFHAFMGIGRASS
jgi:G3E family GTPase